MTLKEFAGVDSYLRDLNTHRELEWKEYMHKIITKLGIENILLCVPFNLSYLQRAYQKDPILNNTSLSEWDRAADKLSDLLRRNGVTYVSLSERVCVLKETAILIIEKEGIK